MKNQYFGDVGVFGKFGLLKELSSGNLKLGVNWFLTKDDAKTDGKYTDYLKKLSLRFVMKNYIVSSIIVYLKIVEI